MEITIRSARVTSFKTPLLAIPSVGQPFHDAVVAAVDSALGGALRRIAREEGFKGKVGQTVAITGLGGTAATRIVLAGLDATDDHPAARLRTFASRLGRMARDKGLTRFALVVPTIEGAEPGDVVRWLAEGARSGIYRYEQFLTGDRKPRKPPSRCVLVIPSDGAERPLKASDELAQRVALGESVMAGVTLARDLVNEPPNTLTPAMLARRARQEAEELGLEVVVNDLAAIEADRMGLLKAVGQGSRNPPHFVHATYRPPLDKPRGTVALVGKGITFDSGGLSLKTAKGQTDMKSDMGGAAVVLGALKAAALCKLPFIIHGLIPTAENMPGGSAIRPGDVFTSRNGMTVEVVNTDAEGRLILADALAYAADLKPDVIIDFATLTGACVVALGPVRAGLFGTDEGWIEHYTQAASRAGEAIWRLPLARELADGLKSQVADLKNVGGSWGGSITAALFLKEFVGSTAWIHLDIAGPAFLEKPHGFHPKGGTGYGVLTLAELLKG